MPLYTKNGSIPSPQTDGTDGWVLVGDKPACPDGQEVVWLNWEWIVRDPKPTDSEGYQWNWVHIDQDWVESEYPATAIQNAEIEPLAPIIESLSTTQVQSLTTEQISGL